MPACNTAKTLQRTYDKGMEQGIVDLVILVDDASRDETSATAAGLPHTRVFVHERNRLRRQPEELLQDGPEKRG